MEKIISFFIFLKSSLISDPLNILEFLTINCEQKLSPVNSAKLNNLEFIRFDSSLLNS